MNQVTNGTVLAKTGAERVLTATLPEQSPGIALKIFDGSEQARSTTFLAILGHLGLLSDAEKYQLKSEKSAELRKAA